MKAWINSTLPHLRDGTKWRHWPVTVTRTCCSCAPSATASPTGSRGPTSAWRPPSSTPRTTSGSVGISSPWLWSTWYQPRCEPYGTQSNFFISLSHIQTDQGCGFLKWRSGLHKCSAILDRVAECLCALCLYAMFVICLLVCLWAWSPHRSAICMDGFSKFKRQKFGFSAQ